VTGTGKIEQHLLNHKKNKKKNEMNTVMIFLVFLVTTLWVPTNQTTRYHYPEHDNINNL
jgi:hypothetical protein